LLYAIYTDWAYGLYKISSASQSFDKVNHTCSRFCQFSNSGIYIHQKEEEEEEEEEEEGEGGEPLSRIFNQPNS